MGKLEEFTLESVVFEAARKGIQALANSARREWNRPGSDYGCYRILTYPEDELKKWDEKGGYIVKDSYWGRFVCTANKYLPWMMEQDLVPPWLMKADVMFDIEKYRDIKCLKYAQAAVGAFPIKRRDSCEPALDMYVSSKDLVLSECWSDKDILIENVKRVFINPEADPGIKEKAEGFAKRHNIPIVYEFPDPEIDVKHEKWVKGYYPPEVVEEKIEARRSRRREELKEPLKDLVTYLKNRSKECWDQAHPPRDVAAAALAEAYDLYMQLETPLGASDAVAALIELGESSPSLIPAVNFGQPMKGCKVASLREEET